MAAAQSEDRTRLDDWLSLLGGPGYKGKAARDRAVSEMRAAGPDRLFPLLATMLTDADAEARCSACEAMLWIDANRALELVMPLLDDPDAAVRCELCGCLHDFADESATARLINVLQRDPDPQVRGMAAYALGGIGNPGAIPALISAMESDHEFDMHGHSPSSCSAQALDDILGTEETRIRVSASLRKMRPGKPDLVRLRQIAEQSYQQWSNGHD